MPRGEGLKKVIITPDENMYAMFGREPFCALEIAKKAWAYIKAHDLKKVNA